MHTQEEPPAFLAIGDLHAGRVAPDRLASAFAATSRHPDALFLASPGDITDAGLAEQYDLLQRHTAALPFPFLATMGNHDVMTGPDSAAQQRFRDRLGLDSRSYNRTFAGVAFLFLSTDGNVNGCQIQIQNSLGLLETTLRDGSGPLFVFCHAPLVDTVGCVDGRMCFLSTDPNFGLPQSDEVRALVRASGRCVVWISGHVHAPLDAENLFLTERLGSGVLHSVSLSCPFFTGRDFRQDEPIALFQFRLMSGGVSVRMEDAANGVLLREEWLELC